MMKIREPAWRVFATEYNASTLELKGEGERAPSYVISPLGAMVNRIFIVGILTDLQNIGTEHEPYWRATVSDGTDRFYIYAGKYAPDATATLARIEPPAFVAVIGKSRTYSPEEGRIYVSIRPERILPVDEQVKDNWILETVRATLKRIEAVEEARRWHPPVRKVLSGSATHTAEGDAGPSLLPGCRYESLPGTVLEALEIFCQGELHIIPCRRTYLRGQMRSTMMG